jgi:hypothetical protein
MASSLLHFTKNFPQAFRHVVRLLWCSIIPLQVLQEADEQGVHGHGVDGEEAAGKHKSRQICYKDTALPCNHIAAHYDEEYWGVEIIQTGDHSLE